MTRPTPEPVDTSKLAELALATMERAKFPMLATIDGDQPRVRPVSPVLTQGFMVYIANLRMYAKTAQIAANPRVELCYLDADHHQVRITAEAEVLDDRDLLEQIWESQPLLRSYLGSIDNPQLIIYRCTPLQVRYMREWAMEYFDVSQLARLKTTDEQIEAALLEVLDDISPPDYGITDPFDINLMFVRTAGVLRLALEKLGCIADPSHEIAIANSGRETPDVSRVYLALQKLVHTSRALGRGDWQTLAGPRYTECRAAVKSV